MSTEFGNVDMPVTCKKQFQKSSEGETRAEWAEEQRDEEKRTTRADTSHNALVLF